METATLTKWGNGLGVMIPRKTCAQLGLIRGDQLSIDVKDGRVIEITAASKRYNRRKTTIAELFEGYQGSYTLPEDLPALDKEVDWGGPVGNEAW